MTAILLFTLLVFAFALIEFEERLVGRQDERLLADFHSIRLNQTTWPEMQAMMQRWGKLGHAHGPCNARDCAYDITLIGWPSLQTEDKGVVWRWLYRSDRLSMLLGRVGMRFHLLHLRFLVEDGAVRRAHLSISAETEPADGGYTSALLVSVDSHTSLAGLDDAPNNVGADEEELGMHPDFIAGPRGFCTGCEQISLVYTPQIASDELVRLTSFDLSCLTRWRPCHHLSDLAPALIREAAANPPNVPRNSVPCTTPAWALARDAGAIWLIDTIAVARVTDTNPPYGEMPSQIEEDRVRVLSVLKGPTRLVPPTIVRFLPYSGVEYDARGVPEHLVQGRRYFVLPVTDNDEIREGAAAGRCGVIEDTAANELAVRRGMAMNDHLRVPELSGEWQW